MCKKTKVVVDKVISMLELTNCQDMTIVGEEQLQTVNAESCKKVKVVLNEKTRGCKVISNVSRDIWIEGPVTVFPDYEVVDQPTRINLPAADAHMIRFKDDKDELEYEPMESLE